MSKVLVVGAALSGIAASKYLKRIGYDVYLTDSNHIDNKEQLESLGIQVFDNGHPDFLLNNEYEFVVKNPGIKYTVPFIQKLLEKGLSIVNEIEVALNDHPEVVYAAITGTNGKTTTTTMLGDLLKSLNPHNVAAGNIGLPLCEIFSKEEKPSELAIEIAAFQLLGTPSFKPHVSTIMNLSPDHIDYFGDVESYYKAKTLVYKNQTENDYFLRNVDDSNVLNYCKNIPCQIIDFSLEKDDVDLRIKNNHVYFRNIELLNIDRFKLPGMHNVQNAMVAGCMAYLLGVDPVFIKQYLEEFKGVEHRIEFVSEINGVKYYNDSKGTNVDSTIMALKAFKQPVHLLAGGYDKKTGFGDLKPYLNNVKTIYAFGDTKEQFVELHEDVRLFENMSEALEEAYKNAKEGDVVLLSPACASWDQFPNYEVRGKLFKEQVLSYEKTL